MYILKDILLYDDIKYSYPFFLCYSHYLKEALEAFHYVKGNVFVSMITSGLWLILEHLMSTVFI